MTVEQGCYRHLRLSQTATSQGARSRDSEISAGADAEAPKESLTAGLQCLIGQVEGLCYFGTHGTGK